MARPLRIQYENAFYHITGRGNEKKRIFLARSDYVKFKEYLKEAQLKYGFIVHCYVLMGNHYHLIGETPRANLSAVMHSINGAYTTYFNKKRKRSGHLFQGRYKAILIDHDSYLLELSRYVHLNPVRTSLAERPEEYAYSSYRSYILPEQDDVVSRDRVWSMISGDRETAPARYREFVEEAIPGAQETPLAKTYGGMILGGKDFVRHTLQGVKEGHLDRKEISSRRALASPLEIGDIINVVKDGLHVPEEELMKRGTARNVAIYLTKLRSGYTNREIGEYFGHISYSAVTRICERLERAMKTERDLGDKVSKLLVLMSNIKG
jgi:putative transposase